MREALLGFIGALVLTEAIECLLALLFRSRRLVYAVFLVNLLTNPVVNLALALWVTVVGRQGIWWLIAVLEITVVLVEARLLMVLTGCSGRAALARSLLFNAVSFGVGLVVFPLFPI